MIYQKFVRLFVIILFGKLPGLFIYRDNIHLPNRIWIVVLYYLIKKGNYDVAEFVNKTVPDNFVLQIPPLYKLEDIKFQTYQNPFNFYFKNFFADF